MTAEFQLVIDCADPEPLARFWVAALGYEFEPPPDGYDNWDDYWRAVGVSEDELGAALITSSIRPGGARGSGSRWCRRRRRSRTGCTSTSRSAAGRRIRSRPGAGSSTPRRGDWRRSAPPWSGPSSRTAWTTTGSPCGTPRATSSTSTYDRWPGAAVARFEYDIRRSGVRHERERRRVLSLITGSSACTFPSGEPWQAGRRLAPGPRRWGAGHGVGGRATGRGPAGGMMT